MNAKTPYRDDHAWLPQFVQHVKVAESLLQIFAYAPQRMRMDMEDGELADLQREARTSYETMWENLGQARELARARGRDVSGYDRARAAAGNIWNGAQADAGAWRGGIGPMGAIGRSRQVYWASAPVEPAIAAILALKAAAPEVVIAPPMQEPHIDVRSHGWLRKGWPALIVLLVAAVFGLAWMKAHGHG
jgi:hypothetical protein